MPERMYALRRKSDGLWMVNSLGKHEPKPRASFAWANKRYARSWLRTTGASLRYDIVALDATVKEAKG